VKKLMDKIETAVLHIDAGFERVTRYLWYLGGAAILLMAFVVAYGAIARYAFRSPSALSYDIAAILMFFCVAFCIPYTQKLGKHLRLDLFDNIFPKAITRALLNIVGPLLGLIFCGVLTWQCWKTSLLALNISETTSSSRPIPTFPLKLVFTLCVGFLCFVLILQMVRYLFEVRKKRHTKSEIDEI